MTRDQRGNALLPAVLQVTSPAGTAIKRHLKAAHAGGTRRNCPKRPAIARNGAQNRLSYDRPSATTKILRLSPQRSPSTPASELLLRLPI